MSSMKLYKTGMVIGRFQGFHIGHVKLINAATSICDVVLVLIGSAQESETYNNPFDYETRERMIRKVFPDEDAVIIKPIDDINNDNNWGGYVLGHCHTWIQDDLGVVVYGTDRLENKPWYTDEQMYKTSQLVISRGEIQASGSNIRKYLFHDNKECWMADTHPNLHDMYDELRTIMMSTDYYRHLMLTELVHYNDSLYAEFFTHVTNKEPVNITREIL